jgi:hypothetical protein
MTWHSPQRFESSSTPAGRYPRNTQRLKAFRMDEVFGRHRAIQAIAPRCAHCQCRIIGHGTEAGGKMFCSAHCAHSAGFESMRDRI